MSVCCCMCGNVHLFCLCLWRILFVISQLIWYKNWTSTEQTLTTCKCERINICVELSLLSPLLPHFSVHSLSLLHLPFLNFILPFSLLPFLLLCLTLTPLFLLSFLPLPLSLPPVSSVLQFSTQHGVMVTQLSLMKPNNSSKDGWNTTRRENIFIFRVQ